MKTITIFIISFCLSISIYSQGLVYVNGAGSSSVNGAYYIISDADVPYYKNGGFLLYHYNNTHWVISISNGEAPQGPDVYYWVISSAYSPIGLNFTDLGVRGAAPLPTVDDAPLPVELVSFSAKIANNEVQLLWETATEVNNYGFEIERTFFESNDKWVKIGFVEGHGNSNSPKKYSFTDKSLETSGEYSYRIKQIDIDGSFECSDAVNINISAPSEFELTQNYPNPFNPSTTISYSIPEQSNVSIVVYNAYGEQVTKLLDEQREAGSYSILFNASDLASGLYFYTIVAGKYSNTKKLLLLK